MIPMSALGHHGEPADPTLLEWIGHRIDELVPIGSLTIVIVLGVVIVVIPVGLFVWYLVAARRHR
jgi:hypothetical protein